MDYYHFWLYMRELALLLMFVLLVGGAIVAGALQRRRAERMNRSLRGTPSERLPGAKHPGPYRPFIDPAQAKMQARVPTMTKPPARSFQP